MKTQQEIYEELKINIITLINKSNMKVDGNRKIHMDGVPFDKELIELETKIRLLEEILELR